jgi:hypothetical protein
LQKKVYGASLSILKDKAPPTSHYTWHLQSVSKEVV